MSNVKYHRHQTDRRVTERRQGRETVIPAELILQPEPIYRLPHESLEYVFDRDRRKGDRRKGQR